MNRWKLHLDRSRCSAAFLGWIGYFIRKSLAEAKISSAEQAAVAIVENAKKEAEALKKETVLEAKDEVHSIASEAEKDIRERRNEIQRQERRLLQKEESLDKKLESLERKEEQVANKEKRIDETQAADRSDLQKPGYGIGTYIRSYHGRSEDRSFSQM